MSTPTPDPHDHDQHEPARPELHVVREQTAPEHAGEVIDGALVETDPEPVVGHDGEPVDPQAPFDVRLREAALRHAHGVPAFGKALPSLAESLEHSQHGDWATNPNGVKRAVHGLATLVAYTVTWPLVDVLGRARTKPGPFAIAVLLVIAAVSAIAATA